MSKFIVNMANIETRDGIADHGLTLCNGKYGFEIECGSVEEAQEIVKDKYKDISGKGWVCQIKPLNKYNQAAYEPFSMLQFAL